MDSRSPAHRGRAAVARCLVGLTVAGVVLMATAGPAAAHGLGGPGATDQRVEVSGVRPELTGVRVRTIDLGTRIEVTNRGRAAIVVLGYEGEPYLRVGPRGVEVNRRSPATFLNRTATPSARPPRRLDASAAPEWSRIATTPTARWHDHRAHWMGRGPVRDLAWSIPLRSARGAAEIRGTITPEAAPSPWPWITIALGLLVVLVLGGRTRRWPTALACGLALLAASETVHLAGAWGIWTTSVPRRLLGAAPSIVAVATCIGALALLAARRSRPDAATPLALLAGVFTALAGGLADLPTVTHAIVPSTLGPGTVRATVAIALGAGAGVSVVAAAHLRPRAATVAVPAEDVSG